MFGECDAAFEFDCVELYTKCLTSLDLGGCHLKISGGMPNASELGEWPQRRRVSIKRAPSRLVNFA